MEFFFWLLFIVLQLEIVFYFKFFQFIHFLRRLQFFFLRLAISFRVLNWSKIWKGLIFFSMELDTFAKASYHEYAHNNK